METRTLGNTDLQLSVIGLGTWAIGGGDWDYGWGPQVEADSVAAINEALDHGINWIDTAAIYGLGLSEQVVGKVVRNRLGRVIVATKCGLIGDHRGRIGPNLTPDSVRRECEASLTRLGVDVIDLYQIHWPNPENQIEHGWETLQKLKDEGKIRWAGVSNFNAAQLELLSRIAPVSSLQPPYSALSRDIETEILPFCREHSIGVIPYSPMQAGLLTDKFSRAWVESLSDKDWRKHKSPFLKPSRFDALENFINGMRGIARSNGCSIAQLSVAWVTSTPGITSAIVGARRAGQITETIKAAEITVTESDRQAIDALFADFRKA